MALAQQRFQANLYQGMFCKLNNVMEMVLWVVRQAKRGEDFKLFLQASREFSRIIQLMHKIAPQLQFDPEFLYCLMASPEWDLQEDALLPHAFQALSKTRQTLKVNLFSPCPETAPESEPDHQPTPFRRQTSALPPGRLAHARSHFLKQPARYGWTSANEAGAAHRDKGGSLNNKDN